MMFWSSTSNPNSHPHARSHSHSHARRNRCRWLLTGLLLLATSTSTNGLTVRKRSEQGHANVLDNGIRVSSLHSDSISSLASSLSLVDLSDRSATDADADAGHDHDSSSHMHESIDISGSSSIDTALVSTELHAYLKNLKFKRLGELREAAVINHERGKVGSWYYSDKEFFSKSKPASDTGYVYVYDIDNVGRVVSVSGFVPNDIKKVKSYERKLDQYQDWCKDYIDAVYWHQEGKELEGKVYEAGHMIGKDLGGSCWDPLNFFPHHTVSNHGVYYRMERIAKDGTKKLLGLTDATGIDCSKLVWISITYNYGKGAIQWYPLGGTYTIQLTKTCAEKLATTTTVKRGKYTQSLINMVDKKMIAKSGVVVERTVVATGGGVTYPIKTTPGYELSTNWVNSEDDSCDQSSHPDLCMDVVKLPTTPKAKKKL